MQAFPDPMQVPNGHVSTGFPPRLGVSAVKSFIDLSKSAGNKRAKRPASDEVSAYGTNSKYQLTRYTRNTRYTRFSRFFRKYEIYEIFQKYEAYGLPVAAVGFAFSDVK
jgi:hypothetical protein